MGALAAEMLGIVRDRVDDLAGNNWSDAQVYAFLSAGQMHLATQLPGAALYPLMSLASTPIVAGQNAYALPAGFLREMGLQYKGLWARRWIVAEVNALLNGNTLTAPSEAEPYYVIWDGILLPGIVPTQAGTDVILLWYFEVPPPISGSQEPLLPEVYHNPIEDWAVSLCMESRGEFQVASVEQQHALEQIILIDSRYQGKPAFDGVPNDPRLDLLQRRG